MDDINVSLKQENDFSVHLHADSKLQQELEAARARAEQLDSELKRTRHTVEQLSNELNNLKTTRGIIELENQLDEFRNTASRSLSEFKDFLTTVQLQDFANVGEGFYRFREWFHNISEGAQTVSEAIAEVKAEYSELIRSSSRDSSGSIDSQMLRTFTSTLQSVASSIDEVRAKLTEFQENGIRAIPNVQGSDSTISGFEQVKNTIKEMADSASGAYEPLTKLIGVMTDYANIDNTKLFSVSQAIAGLGEIGKGSYSVKSVENTINLLTRLQTLTRAGAIHFNITGLEAFSNLSVRKASLNNLATFLPTIASVDVTSLERLSHVDLTNFNNLDIKKASMNNLVQMIDAVNNMRVDTSWATDLIQLTKSISESVAKLSESTEQKRAIDLNIDKSSFQGLETILNDINNAIQNTDVSKASSEMSEMGEVAQRVALYLGRYRDALHSVSDESSPLGKVESSLAGLGIAEKDISVISKHLSDMNIKVKSITPEWETITAEIDDEITKVQRLKQITVQGVTTLGDAVNHVIKFNAETGDISKEITKATVKGKEFKQTIKELADGTKEVSSEKTIAELREIDGLIKSIEKTNSKLNSSKNKAIDLLGGLSTTGQNKAELDAIIKKFDELMTATERLRENRNTANQEDIDGIRKIQTELDGLIRKSQERLQPAKIIDFTLDTANVKASVDTVRRRLQDLKEPAEETTKAVNALNDAFNKYQSETNSDAKKAALSDINKRIQIANKLLSEQETIQKRLGVTERKTRREAAQNVNKQNRLEQEANAQKRVALDLLAKIAKAQQEWTKARNGSTSSEYAKLQTYSSQLNTLLSNFANHSMKRPEFIAQVRSLGDEFARTSSIIQSAGEDTKTLRDRFGALAGAFSMWFSTTRIIMMVYSNIRKMISASIELDASLTQLQIVTKENDEAMTKFGNSAADAARRIGSSITDFTSSVTTFARLGYSIGESSQLAEFTAMLQNVGDIDVAEAQEAITSIVKAFNIGTDQIESVMDKMVVSGNNFPISVSQIAEGMKNASSALAAAGNSFDQSVALLTAANTTIDLCRVA